jgi:ornithine carbamoyltransferase
VPSSRDFLSLRDRSTAEIIELLDQASQLRHSFRARTIPHALDGVRVALIWDAEGFRHRVAFELGIALLGGTAIEVPGRLDERESIAHLALAKPDVLFLPCPPVHRGEELSADAIGSPHCRVYEAKDWLLHAQNALMMTISPETTR